LQNSTSSIHNEITIADSAIVVCGIDDNIAMPGSCSGEQDLGTTMMETTLPLRTHTNLAPFDDGNDGTTSQGCALRREMGETTDREMESPGKDSELSSDVSVLGVGKAGLPVSLPS
jgi:hypothetical protein